MNTAYPCQRQQRRVGRRDFLWELGGGLGGVALSALINEAEAATVGRPGKHEARQLPGKLLAIPAARAVRTLDERPFSKPCPVRG